MARAKGIDQFTRERFEAALPKAKATGLPLWKPLGLYEGEYSYILPVGEDGTAIMIRSSVDASGAAATCGSDSIRCWLVRLTDKEGWNPWGSKVSRWVTRQKGWEGRLLEVLGTLYKMGLFIRPCPACHKQYLKIFISKRDTSEGELFVRCSCNGFFKWLEKGEDGVWRLVDRGRK